MIAKYHGFIDLCNMNVTSLGTHTVLPTPQMLGYFLPDEYAQAPVPNFTVGVGGVGVTFGTEKVSMPSDKDIEKFFPPPIEQPPMLPPSQSGYTSGPIDPSLWNTVKAMTVEGTWGLGTGTKANVNGLAQATVSTLTLGFHEIGDVWEMNEFDLAVGGATATSFARGGYSIGFGAVGGHLGCVAGKVGQVARVYDLAGSVVEVGRGGIDMYNNGASPANVAQVIGNSLGVGANTFSKCFTTGTQVIAGQEFTEGGVFVQYVTMNIEDVQVGDLVYSYDTTTGEISLREVTATFERRSDHLNYLTIIDGDGKEQTLETTDGHPFWVVTNNPDQDRAARDYVFENGL
jgi:hypothetical protein